MKKIFLTIFLLTNLFSLSLKQYIHKSINNSNDAKNLIDSTTLNQFDLDSANHNFDFTYSPKSSISTDKNSDTISLGLQGSKNNTYGGQIYGDTAYSRQNHTDTSTQYETKTTIGYKQSLFKQYGSTYNTLGLFKASKNNELIKYYNKQATADIIIKSVELYYSTLLNKAQIKIHNSSLQKSLKNYKASKAKQKAGIVPKIDVYRARLSYLDQQNDLKNQTRIFQKNLENLYLYINQDIKSSDLLDTNISNVKYNLPKYAFKNSLNFNLSWQEMLTKEEILRREIFNAKRDFMPDLEFDMKYNKTDDMDDNWNITLGSSYSFDHFNENIKFQKLIIEKSKLLREKESLKRTIANEYRQLRDEYNNIKENLKIYQMKKDIALESLEVAKIRFERGLSDNMDIIDAQNSYTASQIDIVTAQIKQQVLYLKIAKHINILDFEFIQKVYL